MSGSMKRVYERNTNKNEKIAMKTLVTGAAGFIGSALVSHLLGRGDVVIGLDNHNSYYDPALKEARVSRYLDNPNYTHIRADIANQPAIEEVFSRYAPTHVVHLAAQAGVRFSIEQPLTYIESNIVGFTHVLEACRHHGVEHLVYASSSSVYGANSAMPFSVHDSAGHPLSLYAATKRSNELMAHAYSHLYNIPTTGLRFFTVYGPWGRPDMALFKFTKAILAGKPIDLFNFGNHHRDFTYVDDIVEGIERVLVRPAFPNTDWNGSKPDPATSLAPWRIYNIGSNNPVKLLDYIKALEDALNAKAIMNPLPMQPGDVADTFADVDALVSDFDYQPSTVISDGVQQFVHWYRQYFNK